MFQNILSIIHLAHLILDQNHGFTLWMLLYINHMIHNIFSIPSDKYDM